MRTFTTVDLNKAVGDVTEAAQHEPVVITRHRKPRFVLMSIEHYERIMKTRNPRQVHRTARMPSEHADLFGEAVDRLARGEGYDNEP